MNTFQNLKTVVFAGGGAKGLGVIGALQKLRDVKGIDFGAKNPKLDDVAGVSVGSVFALMVVLGYTVAEITEFSSKLNSSSFLNTSPVTILLGGLSIDDGKLLKLFVDSIFVKKNVSKNITFAKLKELTKTNLHLVVTNLTKGDVEHISADTHPNLNVNVAMLGTMSVPLIFPPVISPNGDIWIDGGVLENFPMMKFDPYSLLGFDFKQTFKQNVKFDSLLSYISRIMQVRQIPLDVVSWKLMSAEHQKRSVIIDTGETEFIPSHELTSEQRLILIEAGANAMNAKIQEIENHIQEKKDYDLNNIRLPTYLISLNTCKPQEKAHQF